MHFMVNKLSNPVHAVLAVSCAGLLLAGNGCSRMMSPPGQRLFGQNATEPRDWNFAAEESDPSSELVAPQGLSASSVTDATQSNQAGPNAIPDSFLTPQGALDQQFASSMKIPDAVPPRLIPIESVAFPGDETTLATASATMTDAPHASETLAVALSDEPDSSNRASEVRMAGEFADADVTQGEISKSANLKNSETQSPNGKVQAKQDSINPNKQSTLDYNRTPNQIPVSSAGPELRPDTFQAARRATASQSSLTNRVPVTDKTSNPEQLPYEDGAAATSSAAQAVTAKPETDMISSKKSPAINSATKSTNVGSSNKTDSPAMDSPAMDSPAMDSPAMVSPAMNSPAMNSPAMNSLLKQENATISEKPSTSDSLTPKDAKVAGQPSLAKDFTKRMARMSAQNSSGHQAALAAAGIKVSASAFEVSSPKDKAGKAEQPIRQPMVEQPAVKALTVEKSLLPVAPVDALDANKPNSRFSPVAPPISSGLGTAPARKFNSELTIPASSGTSNQMPIPNQSAAATIAPVSSLLPAMSVATPKSNELAPPRQALPSATGLSAQSEFKPSIPNSPKPMPTETAESTNVVAPAVTFGTKFSPSTDATQKPSSLVRPGIPDPSAVPITQSSRPGSVKASESSDLKLVNCLFCTEIKGFGQVTSFPSTRFRGNQRTLVYCEVENYKSQLLTSANGDQFVTRFRGEYQIVNQQTGIVQSGQFPEIEDVTGRKRRDFYLYFPITFKNLPAGKYELQLTIHEFVPAADSGPSNRIARQALLFSVE
jgi:hypothetical protein